jgi:hypothetical protein
LAGQELLVGQKPEFVGFDLVRKVTQGSFKGSEGSLCKLPGFCQGPDGGYWIASPLRFSVAEMENQTVIELKRGALDTVERQVSLLNA